MKHRVEMSLSEQMQVHDLEISNRKQLLGFAAEDAARLRSVGERLEGVLDEMVDEFYDRQLDVEEIALIIGDADTLSRLRAAQHNYIIDLFAGVYDLDYVNNRLRIGQVHKRIGVEPKHYLSAMAVLKNVLVKYIRALLPDTEEHQPAEQSLDKLLNFDTQLVMDTYIRSLVAEVESAKAKVERYAQTLEDQVAARTLELHKLSQHDPLTGLYNRRALTDFLSHDLANVARQGQSLSFLFIDVDGFKGINDSLGHQHGDVLLQKLATSMQRISREGDIPCRIGGDEFGLVLLNSDEEAARQIAERLVAHLASVLGDCSCSIGVASCGDGHYDSPQQLIRRADQAMYQAKASKGFSIICATAVEAPGSGEPVLKSV